MNSKRLVDVLDSISEKAKSQLPLEDEDIKAIESRPESEIEALGASIDQDFSLKIQDGEGTEKESKNTYGVTLNGYFSVKSPDDGTWEMVAKVAGNTVVDKKNVKKGEKINFTAKTNFWSKTEVLIRCSWSEKKDATLTVQLHATY
jgi:hypothetical protein